MNVGFSFLRGITKPLFLILAIGILIRLVLMPLFTYDFDMYHWALIISNIDSGNNLYELDGYYYTPVWGYMLGSISAVQQLVLDIGQSGIRFTELLPIEDLVYPYHIATITSISFNALMKVPFVICDILVGYLIYMLVKDRTGDRKKATWGFGLWFLCPIVIYMSSVQGMFDTFSALLLLLTVMLLQKDRYFLGGAVFTIAVLLKFFPGFCVFVLIAYVIVKHKGDGLAKRKLIETVAGAAIMAAVLFMPLVINGHVDNAMSFVFGRVSESGIKENIFTFLNVGIALLGAVFFGYVMYRSDAEKADDTLYMCVFFVIVASTVISMTPQYVIVMIPFLIIHILLKDRRYLKCWVLVGVSAFLGAFILNNYSLFAALSGYTDIVSPGWVVAGMQMLELEVFSGMTLVSLATQVANAFQYIGLLLILLFYFSDHIVRKFPRVGGILARMKGTEAENNET